MQNVIHLTKELFGSRNKFANLYTSWRGKSFSKKIESSLNGSLLFYQIQMSSFWGCLFILYLQPIAPILPGLEEDHSCLLKGSTRNCCKQEICGPSEYGDTPETWLQRIYLPSENKFPITIKRDNGINTSLPLPTSYHHISNVWESSVFTI